MQSPVARQEKGTYALLSLGCPKNLVDSERMAGLLGLDGYRMVAEPEGADFVVINTCGFIADARDESHSAIREMLRLKRRGRLGGVIVAGCLAQRDRQSLLEKYPEIDQLVGVFARDQIGTAADRISSRWAGRARRRVGRAADAVLSRPHAAAGRHPAAADHAAAPGVRQDRRGVQSLVQFLLDPQDAWAVRQQADRAGRRRGRGTRGRRREGIDPGRPGHQFLRRRDRRPAAAGGTFVPAGADRRPGLDPVDVSLSAAHHRRADRRDRGGQKGLALSRPAAAAHQRRRSCSACAAGSLGPKPSG